MVNIKKSTVLLQYIIIHILAIQLTRSRNRDCNSAFARSIPSCRPMIVMSSGSDCSWEFGKTIRAPVFSFKSRMFTPFRPIKNRWYSGFTRSSVVQSESFCEQNTPEESLSVAPVFNIIMYEWDSRNFDHQTYYYYLIRQIMSPLDICRRIKAIYI